MMKRIIALLLALILTVGLLPTVALAADGENPTTDSGSVTKEASKDNLNLVKTVTKEGDNYKVTLESWATGTVTTTTETKPLDIVLLLDVSGSMDDKYSNETIDKYVPYDYNWYGGPILGGYNTTNSDLYDYQSTRYGVWYKIPNSETYVSVNVKKEWKLFADDDYTYSYEQNGSTIIIEKTSNGNKPPITQFYYKESANTTKLDALKTAVSAFIDNVATNSPTSNISIVKFANNRYKSTEGNDTFRQDGYEYNYTQIVKKLTKVNTAGVTALKKAIGELKAGGATASDYGLNKAAEALEGAKQERVVILFTDGEPNHSRYFDKKVATDAVNKARELKTATTKTTIYTVGVFKNPSQDVNLYMSSVSSNYPNASAQYKNGTWTVSNGGSDFGKYYMNATSPVDLLKAFETISSEVSGGELGEEAVLTDVIAPNFALVAPEGTNGVTAYTVDKTADGWSTQKTTLTNGVTVGTDGQVNVTGFDYSENCVTTTAKPNTTNDYGKKLVVEFTIHHNNYGGTQPTNAGASIKDKENKDVITVDNPTVPVTIAKPSITGVTRSKVYDGTGFDVLSTIAEDINALADGKKNAYVDIVVTVTSGSNTYTYTISKGATTGSWDKTGLTTEKDVKIENGAVSSYTYDLSITFKDATANGAADAIEKTTATYTITKRPVTLTSASGEKKWDGTALTNDTVTVSAGEGNTVGGFVTGEGATYNVTGSQTEVGKSDNTFDYTLNNNTKATNYEITKQLGKLKVTQDDTAITVTITGNTLTRPYSGSEQSVTGFDYTVSGGSATKADVIVALKENKTARAAGTNAGKYMMGLNATFFTVSSSKYSNVTITTVNDGYLEITPLAVTLTSGSGAKEYDGTPLTNATVEATGEGASRFVQEVNDFKANGSVKGTADMTTAQSVTNNITYTWKEGFSASNYTITTTPGTLTITPVSQLKITFKTELGGKIGGGTADIEKTAKRNDPFPAVPTTEANTGYYFLGWYDESGNKVEENAFPKKVTGNATYTAKWKKYDSVTLDLTGRFQKELTSDTMAVPDDAYPFTVTIKQDTVKHLEARVAKGDITLAESNGKYTGTAAFTVESGSKMTFNAPGEYVYTVAETKGSCSGMSYDKTTYTMTVKVVANEGGLTIQSATATIQGGASDTVDLLATEGTNSITFHNEYTQPKKSINLGDLIQKNFNKKEADSEDLPTGSSYTFRVRAYERFRKPDGSYRYSDAPYLGEVVMTEFGQKNFVFNNGVITFFEHGTHEYVVEEFNDGAENVEYDSNRYLLVLDVADDLTITARNAGSLNDEVSTQSVEQTPVITFCNKYNKEKDPDKLTINFADFVKKELTATGSKTVDEATFIVDVVGSYDGEAIANALPPTETQATTDEDVLNTTLTATIKNIVGGNVYEEPFTGSVTVSKPGHYTFTLTEHKGTQSGVTYDEAHYQVFVNIMRVGDNLVIHDATTYLNNEQVELIKLVNDVPVTAGYIVFKNTIDTGKDDYYPIIIPTIIGKDTGMLNKTDHFAYVIGYPDGTVHPNGQITRAEVATIFFRLLRDEVRDGAFTTSNTYSDVAYGKWYNNPISTMSALGIITGYPDGTFKPNKPITRAEFAAIAARFDETQSGKSATFSDVIGHWAAKEIGIAYYNDWIKGYPDGTFKPDQNITRAEAMTLINRVLERKPESPADLLTNMNKWTDNLDTSKWYYLDVQEATNSHGYTRKTFNYELWRQMLPDPDWSRYER